MEFGVHDVPGEWSVGTTLDDGIAIVSVAGEVDMRTAPALAAALTGQDPKRPSAVVLDLGQVSFFGSPGINVLLEIHERTTVRGVPLHLVAPLPCVVRSLDVAGLSGTFTRHESLPDALRVIRKAGRAPMRIAVVSEPASPLTNDRGQGSHVAQLAAALAGLGHEVVVYTRRVDPTAADRVSADDGYDVVQVLAGPARRLPEDEVVPHLGEFARFLEARWRLRPPDVVHTHHWTSGMAAVIGARRDQVPVVHSYNALGVHGVEQRVDAERLVARKASWVVASSSQEAAELWRLGVHRARVSVVPSAVDVEHFHPDGPVAARGLWRRLVTVGEFRCHRGFADIITALSTMLDVELVIAGEHPCAAADGLRELAGRLGVLNRIVFAGAVPRADMPALLRSADVVVCAPWSEPFGLVALEAMACGVPVVATAVGALEDVVVHNVTGLHVPPREPRVLARTLRKLLADQITREEFGIAARDRVLARHSRGRVANEALAIYERVDQAATGQDVPSRNRPTR